MKKYTLLLFLFLLAGNCFAVIDKDADNENSLDVEITDPTLEHEPIRRSPARKPLILVNGHSIEFTRSVANSIFTVSNQSGAIEYMVVIPEGTKFLELPSDLIGNYFIQISNEQYFYGIYISL